MFLFIFCHFTIGQQPSQWPFVTLSLLLLLLLVYEIRSSIWSPGTTKLLLISTTNFYHQSLNRVSTTKTNSLLYWCTRESPPPQHHLQVHKLLYHYMSSSQQEEDNHPVQRRLFCLHNYSRNEDESILSLRWLYCSSLVLLLWRCPLNEEDEIYLNWMANKQRSSRDKTVQAITPELCKYLVSSLLLVRQ